MQPVQFNDLSSTNGGNSLFSWYWEFGDPASGVQQLREAIEASSLSPHEISMFRYELAEALLESGEPQEAVEVVHAVLDRIPNAPMMNLVAARGHRELGEREDARVIEVKRAQLPPDVEVGAMLATRDQQGRQLPLTVVELGDETAKLDGNHPFAGKDVVFKVTVADVENATPEELAHGHPH